MGRNKLAWFNGIFILSFGSGFWNKMKGATIFIPGLLLIERKIPLRVLTLWINPIDSLFLFLTGKNSGTQSFIIDISFLFGALSVISFPKLN